MVWQRWRNALLAGALAVAAAHPARAGDGCGPVPAAPACAPAPAAPQFQTVSVTEMVPETYAATRTVMTQVPRTETYTAYRCETVPEVRTRTFTTYRQVPEVHTVNRTVMTCVPAVETRTVMRPVVSYQQVTRVVTRCIDQGHYECRLVPCKERGFRHWCKKHLRRKKHDDCCEPCAPPPMKEVKVWVPCMVTVQVPVTTCRRVCTIQATTVQVTVNRMVPRTEAVQVTTWKCVPQVQTQQYTVMVSRQVPYQATRTVVACVPHEETYTATRMVARVVQKQVPVTTACAPPPEACCEAQPCCGGGHKHHGRRGHHRRHRGCCN